MRKWAPASWQAGQTGTGSGDMAGAIAAMVERLGERDFSAHLLSALHPLLPTASWSAYQVGAAGSGCEPRLFLSASLGVPDTTRACWAAYLSGPVRNDASLRFEAEPAQGAQLCHITATEVASEHRARVYDAHGMAERVSVVERGSDGALFAVNFYRHAHQRPLSDAQVSVFEQLAPALLALARKHVALSRATPGPAALGALASDAPPPMETLRQRLLQLDASLTTRELDVCTRLLRGMTHDGIAADLAVSAETVKTYRNRAFRRLGIHFRNELFAQVLGREG